MESTYYIELIYKSLMGDISPEEKDQLNVWRKKDAKHEKEYLELKQVWNNALELPNYSNQQIQKIALDIRRQERERHKLKIKSITEKLKWSWFTSLFLALLCCSLIILYLAKPFPNTMGGLSDFSLDKAILWMPDSSYVTLRKGSTFQFEYSEKKRKVFLKGEGFFVVDQDDQRPFIIYSGNSIIEAQASRFFIRHIDDMPFRVVLVDSGNLEVAHNGEEVLLNEHYDMAIIRSGLKKERLLKGNSHRWYYD